ncbi:MAG TPA: thiamine pyrophosphate-dependent enzyme, partial [Caulobacteraceae bacterium]|nr:thiamine pyrophosphate-dependent enzyme [Caulobacteraceae bacterium]
GRTGAGAPGPASSRLLGLGDPNLDWVSLAKGMGVPATRCESAEAFEAAFARAMAEPGPRLIEAVVP